MQEKLVKHNGCVNHILQEDRVNVNKFSIYLELFNNQTIKLDI